MKHILSLNGILLYLLTVLFIACTWEPDSYSRTPDHLLDRRLTLEQARLIFEQENELLSPRPITRSPEERQAELFLPERYTPDWDRAEIRQDGHSSWVRVPLQLDNPLQIAYFGKLSSQQMDARPVEQELQIVKNLEMDHSIPTLKTTLPLAGDTGHKDRTVVEFYHSLEGHLLAMQWIHQGSVFLHTWNGDDPASFMLNGRSIYAILDGYGVTDRGITTLFQISGDCAGVTSQMVFCTNCYMFYWKGEDHAKTCIEVAETYYCRKCDVSHDGYHRCVINYCYLCLYNYTGYEHTCPTTVCYICRNTYVGHPFNHHCPGTFCVICRKAPCEGPCPTCRELHCTKEHADLPEWKPGWNFPCNDLAKHKANPLVKMEIAPSGGWNFLGGTWGNTRKDDKGNNKFHHGIDLAGLVGTPIYAMFDGVVGEKYVVEQPDLALTNGEYPPDYSGDYNLAGNRIYIHSVVDGQSVTFGFWHLNAGTPVATNPRASVQRPFQPGDIVKAGEVIGYLGRTGNAYNTIPHLHLYCEVNGKEVDPSIYLNATINKGLQNIKTPCDN